MKQTMWAVLLILLLSGAVLSDRNTRFTNLKCDVLDPTYCPFAKCDLKVIGRGVIAMNLHMNVLKGSFNNAKVNLSLWRKFNGFRPFMFNTTFDFCKAMACTNSTLSLQRVFYRAVKKYSNVNHTCPFGVILFQNEILFRKLVFKNEHFKFLPLPSGEYQIQLAAATDNEWQTKVYVNLLIEKDLN
ncbi:hypothetical protein KR093_011388 [Drosophila rubida]|uniref:MD-2-related lipid-recognition domain-containing protein n=1 Tax=Drosophila rubida TaxID=30044 RepID=A0AAD4PL70_9MUSC|nr:hypothetical protein KR093_011388 [Drosophila rubida]